VALGLAVGASAADVEFPNADSSGDIASAAAWGGSLPALSDTAIIYGQDCTYTAKSDVEFGLMKAVNPNPGYGPYIHHSLTLDMRPEASGATAANPRTITSSGFNSGNSAMDLLVRGGVWNFKGTAGGNSPTLHNSWGQECSFTFSDGAVINFSTPYNMFQATTSSRFRLTGGSRMTASTFWPYSGTGKCSFEVLDGSSCSVVGLQFGRDAIGWHENNSIVVAGPGSRFSATGYNEGGIAIGYSSANSGNAFCVTNGATVWFNGYSVVGNGPSNTLWLDDNASLTGGTMRVGAAAGATGNRIFVGKGSTLYINNGNFLSLGYAEGADGNTLVASNGYVRTAFLKIGSNGSRNNLLRVYGPDADLDVIYYPGGSDGIFGNSASAGGNVLELDGGTKVDWSSSVRNFWMGGVDGQVSIGNEVRVLNGSKFSLNNFYLGHTNSTENVLSIAGSSQVDCETGTGEGFYVYPGNTLKLTVPAEGYSDLPVRASTIVFHEGSILQVDASAYKSGPQKCKVLSSWKPLTIPASVLAAANASLREGYTLYLSEDGCDLYLHRRTGLVITIY